MHDKLFYLLDDWNQLREEQNEYTETLSRLAGLPNTVETILAAYKDAIEREAELWQKLAPNFEDKDDALMAYAKACTQKEKEQCT